MIVKIWPIKSYYHGEDGKTGGVEGIKNAVQYITDPAKVLATENPDLSYLMANLDIQRTVIYLADQDKTETRYISSYRCSVESAVLDFQLNNALLSVKSHFKADPSKGAVAFHLVQSFPEGLEISDEEVHQCGIELAEKIGAHQALICSHVHPVTNTQGEVHGRCKHNHILINAFIRSDLYDPEIGGPCKYHDCTESYRQLQIYNDEIAIDHGLPIIRSSDQYRSYSWTESAEINKGTSWKERVRQDIEMVRRVTDNWAEFTNILVHEGYTIAERAVVTYTTPDGHRVRDSTLGHQYTKESLELFWAIRNNTKTAMNGDISGAKDIILSNFVCNYNGELSVKIPLGPQFAGNQYFKSVPLNKDIKGDEAAFRSYFHMDQLYDICDETGTPVVTASGLEIWQSVEELRDEEMMALRMKTREDEERIKKERQEREKARLQGNAHYSNPNFRNSRTGEMYCCSYYDQDGRPRTGLELIYVLALVVLDKEAYLWVPRGEIPQNREPEVFFAPTNQKIQRIIDAYEQSQKQGIRMPADLTRQLNSVGAAYSRAKKAFRNTSAAAARMEPIASAIQTVQRTQKTVDNINALSDGISKTLMQEKHRALIEAYESACEMLCQHRITTAESIADFERRYQQIQQDVTILDARQRSYAEQYRSLKKIQYGMQLAQDPYYLYGPAYSTLRHQFSEIPSKSQHPPLWAKLERTGTKVSTAIDHSAHNREAR